MSSILFDFSSIYENRNTYSVRTSTFFKFLEEHNIDFNDYIHNIFTSFNEFYISCGSLVRDSVKIDGKDIYKNYFFRPVSSDKREIMLRGNIEISANGGRFNVVDIYVVDNTSKKSYESKISSNANVRIESKPNLGDVQTLRNIISSVPLVGKEEGLDFVTKWDNYLEFERKFFLDQIGYYKTQDFRIIELLEVKRTADNIRLYKDSLYYDDGASYLYLNKETAGYIPSASFVECIEFDVELENKDLKSKFVSFVNSEIEITAPMEALDENGNLRFGSNNLEFLFRTKRLGGVLKPVSEIIEDEHTIYRFSKFWIDEIDNAIKSAESIEENIEIYYSSTPLLVNVLSGDLALYKRGKQALKDIKEGNVKNPALINYLLNIDLDESDREEINIEDLEWSNPYLDSYQKRAIIEALSTRNIFLIQGPPGTGKTQVISELVYQFNKRNKKVLLSSQTHVAIDNALERLPNELDILPIRLINQERKVKFAQDYLPDRLIDNLYNRIEKRYRDRIENFDVYADSVLKYRKDYERMVSLWEGNKDIFNLFYELKGEVNNLRESLSGIDNIITGYGRMIDSVIGCIDFIKQHSIAIEIKDYNMRISLEHFDELKGIINIYSKEANFESDNLNDYFKLFKDDSKFAADYKNIVTKSFLDKKKSQLNKLLESYKSIVADSNQKREVINNELNGLEKKKQSIYKEHKKLIDELNNYCSSYIDDDANSVPLSIEEKLNHIDEIIVKQEQQFIDNKHRIEVYKEIYSDCIEFLETKENKDDDRIMYSKYLLDNNANVYGITCNANSKYLEERNEYLSELGLGNVDLKNIDFDVTIIDEVSKATPIELLIPILYSKSIILVGDHRQLPPTFKYKENMLEYLSEQNKISKAKLKEYQDMVEDSLFAKLFSAIKKNKAMLINQYRSHSQIVDVINTFYEGKLNVGNEVAQDEAKQHHLETSSNGFELFTPNIHTYWFNSHYDINGDVAFEKKLTKGSGVSTSFYNDEEVYLVENILKNMDEGYSKVKEVPSISIISLYGDQVKEIKKSIAKLKFSNIDMNASRVYTVDEFQGKEDDIVIVSLVRNNNNFRTGEFTKKFQRINVALSRARKMLVIVGSKEFFSQLDVELPSMNDENKVVSKKIYKDIYEKVKGKVDNPNKYFK